MINKILNRGKLSKITLYKGSILCEYTEAGGFPIIQIEYFVRRHN